MILDGEMDKYPEAAFNLKGNIDDVIAAGEKMLTKIMQLGTKNSEGKIADNAKKKNEIKL